MVLLPCFFVYGGSIDETDYKMVTFGNLAAGVVVKVLREGLLGTENSIPLY